MRSAAAATIEPLDRATSVHRIVRRPSATFLILKPISGEVPEPGAYAGEVELAGVEAPCAITVLDREGGDELWVQPRGPVPRNVEDGEAILRFGVARRAEDR